MANFLIDPHRHSSSDLFFDGGNLDTFEYNLDYFSGAQAAVYIGDILIDEVTSLQWTVQQSKVPIYGYASQTFDEMANGTIIVQGSFSINFTHSGYLWSALESNARKEEFAQDVIAGETKRTMNSFLIHEIREKAKANNDPDTIDHARLGSEIEAYRKLLESHSASGLTTSTSSISKYMNDIVWGSQTMSRLREVNYADELRTDRRELNGFDIYLQFQHDAQVNPSVRRIEDVHLIGKAQTIVIDENPIQEVYSFYAKNVI